MGKIILLAVMLTLFSVIGFAQQQYYDFNAAVPANFSSSGVALMLSGEHVKDGANGLKWSVHKGSVLTADKLGIVKADIDNPKAGSAQFFIYSPNITTDTLVFRFYNKSGALEREGHMLLNYKGWRDYHRSYRFDYNKGNELPGFDLDKMEIIYKLRDPAATAVLYLDAFRITGDTKERCPGATDDARPAGLRD